MAFDVFISFKNTAPGGGLTLDRAIAERIHAKLRDEGLEVFFSERDLDNAAFMNQIYGALEEAQLLVLVGTSVEHIKSKWVMSEWRNFLGAMNSGKKPNGQMITVLSGITTNDLPIEISNMQSFHANDIDGICKFVFKALGKFTNTEVRERIAQEEERKRREAEEAALREMRLRMEAEAAAERERIQREKEQLEQERKRMEAEAAAERARVQHEKEKAEQEQKRKEAEETALREKQLREKAEQTVVHERTASAARRKRFAIVATAACAVLMLTIAIMAFFMWKNSFIYVDGERVDKSVTELVLDDQDIDNLSALKNYSDLKRLQLTDVELTDEELWLAFSSLPDCYVRCTVDLFGQSVDSNTTTIDLSGNTGVSLDELAAKLKYFANVKTVNLTDCGLDDEAVWSFDQNNEIGVVWNVSLCGQNFSNDVSAITLSKSDATLAEFQSELEAKRKYFKNLKSIDLSECGYDNDELMKFAESSGLKIVGSIELGGNTFKTGASSIDLSGNTSVTISDIENSIKYLPALKKIDVSYCGFDSEQLWNLEQSSGVDFVWDVSLGGETFKTDVTELDLSGKRLTDISVLKYCTSLQSLDISYGYDENGSYCSDDHNELSDISALSHLQELEVLNAFGNRISDITPLANLTNLTDLHLWCNNISDITPLANLTNLITLDLNCNSISDISSLVNLTNLTFLNLENNGISDIVSLANLTKLECLYFGFNNISDINPIANLIELLRLGIQGNGIGDVTILANFTKLEALYLWRSNITDLTPLKNLTKLEDLHLDSSDFTPAQKDELEAALPNCEICWE